LCRRPEKGNAISDGGPAQLAAAEAAANFSAAGGTPLTSLAQNKSLYFIILQA
jgi:hypothetical protein